jgi:hypothetical protein
MDLRDRKAQYIDNVTLHAYERAEVIIKGCHHDVVVVVPDGTGDMRVHVNNYHVQVGKLHYGHDGMFNQESR